MLYCNPLYGEIIKASVFNQNIISAPNGSIVQIMGSNDEIKNPLTNLVDDIILFQTTIEDGFFYTTFYYDSNPSEYMYYRYLTNNYTYTIPQFCKISEIVFITYAFCDAIVAFDETKTITETNNIDPMKWDLYWKLYDVGFISSANEYSQFEWLSFSGFSSIIYFSTNLVNWEPLQTYNGINDYLVYNITNQNDKGFFKVIQIRN